MDEISIDLEIPFITRGCASRIIRTIVELLLYNRTQIPFPYTTFRAMVKKLEPAETTDDTHSMADIRIKKQREKAHHVVKCVEMVFDTIAKILSDDLPIDELMIIFGKTIYTAKEAFVVTLPAVEKNHFGENHQRSLEKVLRKIGLQLTLCDHMVSAQATTGDTNVFVMLQSAASLHSKYGMNLLENFQLSKRCTKYAIKLKTTKKEGAETENGCCKRLEIFSEEETEQSCALTAIHRETTTGPESGSVNEWFQPFLGCIKMFVTLNVDLIN
uniref:Uncharacterized protein n=1 Tax=Anopheles christyi TaxID=43041 RepID=A0A182JRA4_9DIPT